MARNRKRANQSRRTQPVAARRGAGADARAAGAADPRAARDENAVDESAVHENAVDQRAVHGNAVDQRAAREERAREGGVPSNGAPDPLGHATPDAELVEAQLAAGREDPIDDLSTPEEERELEELATGGNGGGRGSAAATAAPGGRGGAEVAVPAGKAAARRPSPASRLVTFAKGSWLELQRVQWPDRRQVMQATGVVIGFVIVAGVFLGVADWAAGKIIDFILK